MKRDRIDYFLGVAIVIIVLLVPVVILIIAYLSE